MKTEKSSVHNLIVLLEQPLIPTLQGIPMKIMNYIKLKVSVCRQQEKSFRQ